MSDRLVPAKASGLHIERTGDELLVYDARNDTAHAIDKVAAAIFEACNGSRSTGDVRDVAADWIESPIDSDVVDRTIIDLTKAELVIHLDG